MTGAAVFKTLVGNMSGPLALDGFTPCSSLVTPSMSMIMLGISGISLVSTDEFGKVGLSVVKTLS